MFNLPSIPAISTGTSVPAELFNRLIDWAIYAHDVQDVLAHNDPLTPDTKMHLRIRRCRLEGGGAMALAGNYAGNLDVSIEGCNGLDVLPVSVNSHYYVYLIGSDSDQDAIAERMSLLGSLSNDPSLPSGWSLRRRISSFCSDGSGYIRRFRQRNNHIIYTQNPLLTSGSGAVSRTALTLDALVSPDAHTAGIRLRAYNGRTINIWTPGGSTAPALSACGLSTHQGEGSGEVPVVSGAVEYEVIGSTGDYYVNVGGYYFPLDSQP